MTRFQKLTIATLTVTFLLVTMGVVVRAFDAGMGCPDWPLCYGQLVPSLDDYKAWLEWIHRAIAALLGILVLAVAILALKDHRDRRSLVVASFAAIVLVVFQAWLGRETVRLNNSGASVTAHLASAMADLGLLLFIFIRGLYPTSFPARGGSQRYTLLAAFAAAATYALLLFGSNVTAGAPTAATVFPDWPTMGGTFFPPLTDLTSAQVLHRWVAAIVGLVVMVSAYVGWRSSPDRWIRYLAGNLLWLYPTQVLFGAAQVLTQRAPWALISHLALAAIAWAMVLTIALRAFYSARLAGSAGGGDGSGRDARAATAKRSAGGPSEIPGNVSAFARFGRSLRAYVALTKPRIIELLLITTIPAMVLATRSVPGISFDSWGWLALWTLVGGALAAGSANAINCYLDRDIDELMARTRRRPLPAQEVPPENAVAFGIALGVASFFVLAWFVNLPAAFLALLAIAFYVVVYTLVLKRTTTQNIVIGGAAGALPPVIGWAAVTGNVGIPALLLFALVFYWTPPHFWALSLRIRRDYAAAGVPMLPVVRGIPETSRQILLYSVLMVAISLVLFAVARMGAVYLVAALILGAVFLHRAWTLWRQGDSPDESTAEAIRLYRFSISYLTLIFAAVALDALVLIPVG